MNIIGRLTRDAEVRTLSNEKQVVSFSLAINESYRNKQGEKVERSTFFDCAYWLTTKVASFLTKGTLVELTGNLSSRAWLDKNGEPKSGLNFNASQIRLHGGGRKADVSETQPSPKKTGSKAAKQEAEDDLPF